MDLTVGIVLLAMIALFVGLRLYSVLGQRTGHEQRPVTRPEATPGDRDRRRRRRRPSRRPAEPSGFAFEQGAAAGIRAIISADSDFDVARFLEGAQGAYRMVLEAFWKGDREELAFLATDEVRDAFESRDRRARGRGPQARQPAGRDRARRDRGRQARPAASPRSTSASTPSSSP